MKLIKGTEKGFFAVLHDTARHISQCVKDNEEWYVDLGNECLYFDPSHGPNVWDYYFKQTFELKEPTTVVKDYTELVLLKDNSFRSTMNYIYSNFIILNEKTNKRMQPHYEYFDTHNVLGVHIRRTDKFILNSRGTTSQQSPVDLELFKNEIDAVEGDYDSIYLATDCQEACSYMKSIYGKKLSYNRYALRGVDSHSVHTDPWYGSGYDKGFDVLCDSIFLSKCKHLVRSSSNVSIAALYMNLNLTELNLNEKYLGDTESKVYL
jgi:hypothetical protein